MEYNKKCERKQVHECTMDQELADAAVYAPVTYQTAALICVKWRVGHKCDVKSKIRLRQSVCIYVRNNSAKFHPDPIWNDRTFGFLKKSPQQKEQQ